MNKLSQLLIGPELLWVFFYLVVILLIKATSSPVKAMDNFWISTAWWIPLLLVTLTFLLYYVPGVIHSWLLLRIWIACLIGGHFVLNRSLLAHSEQGPGVGTAYMMGIILLFVPLIIGTIWARIKF
jgi:hypothetical protein